MQKRFSILKKSDALNGVAPIAQPAPASPSTAVAKKSQKAKALAALAVVCFFWGTTWVASKEGVRHMPALQMAGIRQTIGGSLYVLFFLCKGTPFPKGKEWGLVLWLSFLNFALSNGLATWGVQYISAGLASIIGAMFPLWFILIGLFGGKGMKQNTAIGLVVGFAGICVIFYEHLQDFLNPDFRLGILLSLIATWSWAFGTLYTKKYALQFNPYFALGLQMIISGPLLYGIALATHNSIPVTAVPWQSWTAIGYLAIFGSVFSFIAYLYALQNLPTEQASIYAYINPVVAYIISALFFGERLTLAIAAGVAIALYGVFRVNRSVRA